MTRDDRVELAAVTRRKRDKAAARLDKILGIAKRHGEAVNGLQHELEKLVDAMSSDQLKSYWKLCQE
jgi:hypothetical protein